MGDNVSQLGELTGGGGSPDLGGLAQGQRESTTSPTSILLCALLCAQLSADPFHQAHPSLLGKANESIPGDKELSRTRLATPNQEASATRQQHPSFCELGVGSRWSPVWAAQLAEAAKSRSI